MFYKMIENKCREWYHSEECTVHSLVEYIEKTGKMRDAQVEAIKLYLFLKIGCGCKPLELLFRHGYFNSINLNDVELFTTTRTYLEENPAAAALFEYALLTNDRGEEVSEGIEKQIKKDPSSIDYHAFFQAVFYNVSYTDYLFSLPMGAGKTYLMAAFIYLDLYFANNEPQNPAFAHNFIIFAPSGLKSSVVPSLKTIQNFNPAWVIPEPAATEIKHLISFEVLDQSKTAKKSNKTKNPNVQKIATHQPLSELFGLVAVTDAEKVILDRIQEKDGQLSFLEESDDEKDRQANELSNLIGKLPFLSIFIDEVHHAISDEIKLRAVVTRWAKNDTVNSVIGFSGTPYLEKAEKIPVVDKLSVATAEITNIVYYYPLINGIGNFLKRPVVKIAEVTDSNRIIENGVREFFDGYKDTVYADGTTAKLGIYCGTIEKLEELVYPLVSEIAAEYGLGSDAILKFHKGNKQYPQPVDSQMQFDTLDKPLSKIRVILLVQIGKEGWDCRSLTGIILSQEGDCPKNMVLQTSCRCLRQVDKSTAETALIYLNDGNADKLNAQLQQQHHISLKEFTQNSPDRTEIRRYDRTAYLKLPKIDFYQFKVNYETLIVAPAAPETKIPTAAAEAKLSGSIIKTTDLSMKTQNIKVDDSERGTEQATFSTWLHRIVRGSFGSLTMQELSAHSEVLNAVYHTITYEKDGIRFYSSCYDHAMVEANIRKAFCEERSFITKEELIPEAASLLNIANFTSVVHTETPADYYPEQDAVERIILDDKGKLKVPPAIEAAILALETDGSEHNRKLAQVMRSQNASYPQKNHSFHYLPYRTDSSFEQTFLKEGLAFAEIERLGREVYYNGDRAMTEFKIKCYKRVGTGWRYVGMYTPDFLIIQRRDGKIHKAIITETKGQIYTNDPAFIDKRTFMETEFSKYNNSAFGYRRFDYLYLEDTLTETERIQITHEKICDFFKEKIL